MQRIYDDIVEWKNITNRANINRCIFRYLFSLQLLKGLPHTLELHIIIFADIFTGIIAFRLTAVYNSR